MKLTPEQFETLLFTYTEYILDNTTPDELHTLASDLLVREYEQYSPENIFKEISEVYGEEISQHFLASVTANSLA